MSPSRTFCYVVGTRPNFMKMAPVVSAMRRRLPGERHVLVHTGQHYDDAMSLVFLRELGLGRPDHELHAGSGSHGAQTAQVLQSMEALLLDLRPDVVVVPGDVNSTLAAALAAVKLDIPIAHVEAGLRSGDRSMPEEVNRVLTDQVSALLFTHSPEAHDNLAREGIDEGRVHFVGNTMIDTLVAMRPHLDVGGVRERLGLAPAGGLLVTLHRPALVDGPKLGEVFEALATLARSMEVVFPMHPRTRARAESRFGLPEGVLITEPLGYLDFLALQSSSTAVLTDSGGVQEETTYLGVPCFTLRDNTERPITLSAGTNTLLGLRPERILDIPSLLRERGRVGEIGVPGWDGAAGERIAEILDRRVAPATPRAAAEDPRRHGAGSADARLLHDGPAR